MKRFKYRKIRNQIKRRARSGEGGEGDWTSILPNRLAADRAACGGAATTAQQRDRFGLELFCNAWNEVVTSGSREAS
jgi:hypothetical protein